MDGLEHIHSKGYVHLDIKPENILITKHLEVKIADFGLASLITGEDGNGNFSSRWVGSPPYWSPEIVGSYEYNGSWADLYALGITLFIMVFGCRPFEKADMSNSLFSLLLENPVKFWKTHPITYKRILERTISVETLDILTKMLLVNPENRLTME